MFNPTFMNSEHPGGNVFQQTGTIFVHIQDIIKTNILTKVLTSFYNSHIKENATPPGGHVFQPTRTILKVVQDIIGTNLLTKFHEDHSINVAGLASRVLARKNAPHPDIIGTNLLTEFHDHRTINVASYSVNKKKCPPLVAMMNLLPKKNASPPVGHVLQPTGTIFELVQDIIGTNLLTKFHKDWTIYLSSRVLTEKNALTPGCHVFKATRTIFELVQDIIGTNLLSKFHDYRKINPNKEKCPAPGGHVFQPTGIIFELVQYIIGMNLLTKFHKDRTINVASRVLTRSNYSHIRKNVLPLGSHVFQANIAIFELIQYIIETNLLTKFHEYWTINVASRVLTRQLLTPHDRQKAITKAHHEHITRALTRFYYSHRWKKAPPKAAMFFNRPKLFSNSERPRYSIINTNVLTKCHADWNKNVTLGTNVLIKFHEDWTNNMASRVLTR
ncbi:hypothetical protein DPMN_023933 [Dreissena polymorpha]|uniref:Uncharacterized protein n=1 Tax=Dreissena polymorpha TaxID=45954 RepID=A0A9D4LLR8_DREPO|nr:hypothetical protein DPMN_023933 [Dreissena polymorpha]